MAFNFSEDLKKVQTGSNPVNGDNLSLEEKIARENDPEYQKSKKEHQKQQNTLLVQTVMYNPKFVKLLNQVINEKKTREKFSNVMFNLILFAVLIFYLIVGTGSLIGLLGVGFLNFLWIYAIYLVFFKSAVNGMFYKNKISKLKSYFDNNDSLFLSFLDSLINNKFIGSGLPKDYGINPGDSSWLISLKLLLENSKVDEDLAEFLKSQNYNMTNEVKYWELNALLHKYYADRSNENLIKFLKPTISVLTEKMKSLDIESFDNKQELFHKLTGKFGK